MMDKTKRKRSGSQEKKAGPVRASPRKHCSSKIRRFESSSRPSEEAQGAAESLTLKTKRKTTESNSGQAVPVRHSPRESYLSKSKSFESVESPNREAHTATKPATPRKGERRLSKSKSFDLVESSNKEAQAATKPATCRKVGRRLPAPKASYTSDGSSFESVIDDDDDDMLPDINITSPFKGKKYAKDDIVWAPYLGTYWPALVTSVVWPKVRFLFINENGDVRSTRATRLIPFDDPIKNQELKELGEKSSVYFSASYELVIKYLCARKENAGLNARRFLTLRKDDDKVGQAKDCLFRITGMFENEPKHCDGNNSDCNEPESDEVVPLSDDDNEDEKYLNGEDLEDARKRATIKKILDDLNTVPANMTISSKKCADMEVEAKKILEVIQSKECKDYLMAIRNGSIKSSRHEKFIKRECVHAGLGPFTLFSELTTQLLSTLDSLCDDYDEPEYKHKVMLPEAIIFAISEVRHCKKLKAKQLYHSMSNIVEVRD